MNTARWQATALLTGAVIVGVAAIGMKAMGQSASPTGVLVLAHGGQPRWNAAVRDAVTAARLSQPARIAFGMGMEPEDVTAIQQAVTELESAGVKKIITVPLLVSPDSEVMRQFAYLLGVGNEPGFHPGRVYHGRMSAAVAPVAHRMPIVMTDPLGGHELIAQILLERAQKLSADPGAETVLLVGHGPNEDADDARWLETLRQLGAWVRQHGRFRRVEAATLRDDAPEAAQEAATATLRRLVSSAGREGRVLVVPVLVAPGGIEHKIRQRLEGLTYEFSGETLLPHPNISRWIAEQAAAGSDPANKGNGTGMAGESLL